MICVNKINPLDLPEDKILDWSKQKKFGDHILKCFKNEK